MLDSDNQRRKTSFSRDSFKNLKDITIFISLILVFSASGFIWKHYYDYKLFGIQVLEPGYSVLIKYIILTSYWILTSIFSVPLTYTLDTSRLYFSSESYIYIYNGCSGLKEMAMFLFIMLFFPGKQLAKLWFIPLSLTLIYFIAVLRIVFLGLAYKYEPTWFYFLHEYLFNLIFFALFFALWLAWIKWFYKKRSPVSETKLKTD